MQEMQDVLEYAVRLAPQIGEVSPLECAVLVADRDTIIFAHPGKGIDARDFVGKKAAQGGAIHEAISTGRRSSKKMSAEIYGVPMLSTAVPIKDGQGNIVGALSMCISLEMRQMMEQIANNLAAAAEEMTATSQELAATATELATGMDALKKADAKVIEDIGNTDEILRFINDVSANSNLLGLNAAIEAARAGEHGRGFAVVAEEIRKMAVNSGESVKRIQEILGAIKGESIMIENRITELLNLSERQAAATEQIAAAIQELSSSANNVGNAAENMFRN